MTTLHNSIHISASPEQVWSVLATLDALHQYDPGIAFSEVTSERKHGVGADRKCETKEGGWFKERVSEWQPHAALAFELYECTLPVKKLKHTYALRGDGGGTIVHQRMEYQLKFGVIGRLMDVLMVQRKWNSAIKSFLTALKRYVESGQSAMR